MRKPEFNAGRFVGRLLGITMLAIGLLLTACGESGPGGSTQGPTDTVDKKMPDAAKLAIWGKTTSFPAGTAQPKPFGKHLHECDSDRPCEGGHVCVGFGGGASCLMECDPSKGEGEVQNPDCVLPENCMKLSSGSGACMALPGHLYGSGVFTGMVRLKKGEKCLIRMPGCDGGLLCVDTQNDGSVGQCVQECVPATHAGSKRQPDCPQGEVCSALENGQHACFKK